MASEVFDTLEGRAECSRLIYVLNARKSALNDLNEDERSFDGLINYYTGLLKKAKKIKKNGLDKTPGGAEEMKLIISLKKVCAEYIQRIALKGYVPGTLTKKNYENREDEILKAEAKELEDLERPTCPRGYSSINRIEHRPDMKRYVCTYPEDEECARFCDLYPHKSLEYSDNFSLLNSSKLKDAVEE